MPCDAHALTGVLLCRAALLTVAELGAPPAPVVEARVVIRPATEGVPDAGPENSCAEHS